jgi:ankyrin repeat protein
MERSLFPTALGWEPPFSSGTETDHVCTNLREASINGHNPCIITLLSNGNIEINEKDNEGWTPLHIASMNGHNECIITLLNAGADFGIKDNKGWTALDVGPDTIKDTIKQWIEIPIKEPC